MSHTTVFKNSIYKIKNVKIKILKLIFTWFFQYHKIVIQVNLLLHFLKNLYQLIIYNKY